MGFGLSLIIPQFNNFNFFQSLYQNASILSSKQYNYTEMVQNTWYKISNGIIEAIQISTTDELIQLQHHVGGYIEGITHGKARIYVDEEGGPYCKNKDVNYTMAEIFGIQIFGTAMVKKNKYVDKYLDNYHNF